MVEPDFATAAPAVVAAASAASLAAFTEAPVAARVVLVLVVESTNWTTPTTEVVPATIFEPAIAADPEISALTIAPAAIDVSPALFILISPVTATAVGTFDPLPTSI